jgi:hypothetical protein
MAKLAAWEIAILNLVSSSNTYNLYSNLKRITGVKEEPAKP